MFAGIGENMGKGIGVGFDQVMDAVTKDMQKSIPTDFDVASSLNLNQDGYGLQTAPNANSIVEHTGVIEVRGINNKDELTGVVEIIMDQFRREARI
ncbi:MAG: hypothetical protein BWY74_03316 [Firmicutes bacterium ADurb.Bin419]|nr:MAG: hypothetical protein BWY74_03316 [Firmicutes bacterium ADurb.Bin419]